MASENYIITMQCQFKPYKQAIQINLLPRTSRGQNREKEREREREREREKERETHTHTQTERDRERGGGSRRGRRDK